ncbi:hypothetical protein B0T25DRAFT_192956 [Lasiosphaeria hispida]|uniref:Transmembrane protein n=1 Tax=Lasiosphaeria hispida TaxID=260671 RepID=A0AAJ0HHL4_9PEZI|nr:hypothetical protein B0T25DRAFT_192956 [Lasiosphaeria hispida]
MRPSAHSALGPNRIPVTVTSTATCAATGSPYQRTCGSMCSRQYLLLMILLRLSAVCFSYSLCFFAISIRFRFLQTKNRRGGALSSPSLAATAGCHKEKGDHEQSYLHHIEGLSTKRVSECDSGQLAPVYQFHSALWPSRVRSGTSWVTDDPIPIDQSAFQ